MFHFFNDYILMPSFEPLSPEELVSLKTSRITMRFFQNLREGHFHPCHIVLKIKNYYVICQKESNFDMLASITEHNYLMKQTSHRTKKVTKKISRTDFISKLPQDFSSFDLISFVQNRHRDYAHNLPQYVAFMKIEMLSILPEICHCYYQKKLAADFYCAVDLDDNLNDLLLIHYFFDKQNNATCEIYTFSKSAGLFIKNYIDEWNLLSRIEYYSNSNASFKHNLFLKIQHILKYINNPKKYIDKYDLEDKNLFQAFRNQSNKYFNTVFYLDDKRIYSRTFEQKQSESKLEKQKEIRVKSKSLFEQITNFFCCSWLCSELLFLDQKASLAETTKIYPSKPSLFKPQTPHTQSFHTSNVSSKHKDLFRVVEKYKYVVGNCLFDAVAMLLKEKSSAELRSNVVKHIKNHPKIKKLLKGTLSSKEGQQLFNSLDKKNKKCSTVQSYLDRMSKDTTWAGGIEIRALSNLLERPIYVVTPHGDSNRLFEDSAYQNHDPIFLKYEGDHYKPLLLQKDQDAKKVWNTLRAKFYRNATPIKKEKIINLNPVSIKN